MRQVVYMHSGLWRQNFIDAAGYRSIRLYVQRLMANWLSGT